MSTTDSKECITMQNLDSYFIEKGFFLDEVGGRLLLEQHADNHLVRLRMSRKLPHIGVLHYRDDVVFGRGAWTEFAKSCRGVIVDFKNRKIIAKPYRKFFNLGESHAPSLRELEKRKDGIAMEKLDGSMGISVYDEVSNAFYVSTKGDFDSEQGEWATPRLPKSVQDKAFLRKYTLMWEIICKKYQIVIPYDKKGYEEGLYLIGVRENTSEKLFSPTEVQACAKEYGLKTFKTYPFSSIQELVDKSKELPFTEEGYVIRFTDDELMVKIKSAEYLRVHRFVSNLSSKNILDILIAGEEQNVYDNLGMVPEEYRDDVEATMRNYQKDALDFRKKCYEIFATCPLDDRKTFALHVNSKIPGEYKGFLFKLFENKDPNLIDIYSMFRKRKM